jgi:AAA family ATP:ADP antiporter
LERWRPGAEVGGDREAGLGGSVWEGARRTFTDRRFAGITLHMLFFTVLTTFLYFQQAALVDQAIADRTARTRFFANIDLIVNVLALVTQTLATGWFIRLFGVTAALVFLPIVSVAGFGVLAMAPTVTVLMVFQVLRRAGNFAVNQPAREVLFTVVPPRDRYKTKSFIDTFVYRAGDQIGAWSYAPMAAAGLGVTGISIVAAVLGLASIVNAAWLGRRHEGQAAILRDAAT